MSRGTLLHLIHLDTEVLLTIYVMEISLSIALHANPYIRIRMQDKNDETDEQNDVCWSKAIDQRVGHGSDSHHYRNN